MLDTTGLHRGAIAASDYRCKFGPHDAPFTELHDAYSVSYVRSGSFGYRTRGISCELVAGSLLIGCPGDEYSCTHALRAPRSHVVSARYSPPRSHHEALS